MSYIIKSTQPFASTKLTEIGREKLSKGQLNFTTWSIGDSEINYNREIYVDDGILTGNTSIVLRPKDKQPDLKYFVTKSDGITNFAFGTGDIRCIKATVNNEADVRGHFTGSLVSGFTTNTSLSAYTRTYGIISGSTLTGGNTLDISVSGSVIGDVILLKLGYSGFTNETPTPHLWFKVQDVSGTTITVDRELPNLGSGDVTFIVYKGGDIYDNEPDAIAYWDTGTLSFDSSCDISVLDVPIWNMNIPFSESILGTTGTTEYEKFIKYGSYYFIGEKDNYLYNSATNFNKSTAIIHYSNKTISNLYGEYFYIDDDTKNVKLHLPDIMYHKRTFSGSTTGNKMGMTFITSGVTQSLGSNGLSYVSLIEDPALVNSAVEVGRVYPNLKIMTIHNPEIVAAMSYKSNRNWTLPKLKLTLTNPSGGVGTGALSVNETIYVTYAIDNESGSGITPALPCQDYAILTNSNSNSMDVQFNIEDIGLLPYMRNSGSTEGFYGDTFKIIYQKTTNGARPTTENWKVIDFSSSVLSGGTINVNTLESQNPLSVTPNFQLKQSNTVSASTYSIIDTLNMAPTSSPSNLQFGDETFFYGNVETFIGATIFKTIFKITINASDFTLTTNVSRNNDPISNPPNIRVSEVGIYDTDGDLVIISKLSVPVKLTPGKTVILELSMDF